MGSAGEGQQPDSLVQPNPAQADQRAGPPQKAIARGVTARTVPGNLPTVCGLKILEARTVDSSPSTARHTDGRAVRPTLERETRARIGAARLLPTRCTMEISMDACPMLRLLALPGSVLSSAWGRLVHTGRQQELSRSSGKGADSGRCRHQDEAEAGALPRSAGNGAHEWAISSGLRCKPGHAENHVRGNSLQKWATSDVDGGMRP